MADTVRAAQKDWVLLRHPSVEGGHRCAPGAVKHWEKRGWKVVRPDATPADVRKAPVSAPKPAPAQSKEA